MIIVFHMHSGIRYLVLLAAVAALAYLLYGMALRRDFDKLAGALTGAYVGFLDLQVLIGVVLYLLVPSRPAALMGHAVMMLAAVTVGHVANIMNKRREQKSYGVALGGVAVSLLLIVGGIMAIGRPFIGSGGP